MRNKYSNSFEKVMRELAPIMTLDELLGTANRNFNYELTKDKLRHFLYKRNIKFKDFNKIKSHSIPKRPIGYEYTKPDGMILIKVEHPNKWEYKQRYIYEKYHGCLNINDMVIFLDGNRNNFDINNLMAVSTAEYNYIKNKGLISNNAEITKTAILSARLNYKCKEKLENENN